jgi:hypothetical protein
VQLADAIRVFATKASLDERLASGESVRRDSALELRATQLTSERSRRRAARSLLSVVRQADQPPLRTPRAPIDRPAVARARHQLVALARRLQEPSPVGARGMALISNLLHDGTGPLYAAGSDPERSIEQLSHRLGHTASALETQL